MNYSAVQTTNEPKEKEAEPIDAVKFEEGDDTMIAEEDLKVKLEDNASLGLSARYVFDYRHDIHFKLDSSRLWTRCTAMPCVHLPQVGGNPNPTTKAILRAQFCPWRHIVRPFDPSEIPERVAKIQKRKRVSEEY